MKQSFFFQLLFLHPSSKTWSSDSTLADTQALRHSVSVVSVFSVFIDSEGSKNKSNSVLWTLSSFYFCDFWGWNSRNSILTIFLGNEIGLIVFIFYVQCLGYVLKFKYWVFCRIFALNYWRNFYDRFRPRQRARNFWKDFAATPMI